MRSHSVHYNKPQTIGIFALLGLLVLAVIWLIWFQPVRDVPSQPRELIQDYNCPDFDNWQQAWEKFIEAGGPEQDPYRLDGWDGQGDGFPCEGLPGAPDNFQDFLNQEERIKSGGTFD